MNVSIGSGFTLLELMIVVAVVALLLVVGLPAYSDLLAERQLEQAMNQLQADVTLARQMAWHKRGAGIRIRFFPGEQWCYRITDRSENQCRACDDTCDIQGDGHLRGQDYRRWPAVRLQDASYLDSSLMVDSRRGGLTAGYVQLSTLDSALRLVSTGYGRLRLCHLSPSSDANEAASC